MPVQYRWGIVGSKLGPPREFKDARARFRTRMGQLGDDEWRMRRYSKDKWSVLRTRKETLGRLTEQAAAERTDADREAWLFKHEPTGKTYIFREVVVKPDVELPAGSERWHPKLRQAYTLALGEFPARDKLEDWGGFNCRLMRNAPKWSMHSDWKPVLAIDLGHEFGDAGLQNRLEAFLTARIPGLVIVTHKDNDLHRDHCHIQVGENRDGTPRCASK